MHLPPCLPLTCKHQVQLADQSESCCRLEGLVKAHDYAVEDDKRPHNLAGADEACRREREGREST